MSPKTPCSTKRHPGDTNGDTAGHQITELYEIIKEAKKFSSLKEDKARVESINTLTNTIKSNKN